MFLSTIDIYIASVILTIMISLPIALMSVLLLCLGCFDTKIKNWVAGLPKPFQLKGYATWFRLIFAYLLINLLIIFFFIADK